MVEEEEEDPTPSDSCKVILSLVESSVLADRPVLFFFFLILISNKGK